MKRNETSGISPASSGEAFPGILADGQKAMQAGKPEEAIRFFHAALRLAPRNPQAMHQLGSALLQSARYAEAAQVLAEATGIQADDPALWKALGLARRLAGRPREALEALDRALQLEPNDVAAINARGLARLALQDFPAARCDFQETLKLCPDKSEPHFNHGLAAYMGGELALAEDSWLSALAVENPTLAWNLALVALRQEDWKRGWTLAEARFRKASQPVPRHHTDLPAWDGQPMPADELLLWGDQGLGDQLMFARFVPLAVPFARALRLEVSQPLVRLMAAAFPGIRVGATSKTPCPEARRQTSLASLPRIFGLCDRTALGANPDYLRLPETTRKLWAERLGKHDAPRIGLAWAGSPAHPSDAERSAGLAAFADLMPLADRCEFHSLQAAPRSADLAGSCWPIVDWSAQFSDMLDTAGLISQLDLVITVDTAVAHLAGALGRPVWLLVPFTPDWRWSEKHGDNTIWYPGFRLFRQSSPGDWGPVVARIEESLAAMCGAPRRGPAQSDDDDGLDPARCLERLARRPLDRPALLLLSSLAATLKNPKPALPALHRGRTFPEPALALARLLAHLGKEKAALDILRALTGHQPQLLEPWLLRSDLARRLHHAGEAIAAARQAIALREDNADAWLNLANALREDKQSAAALEAIRHAARLKPDSVPIQNNLGVLLKEQGLLEDAISAYQRAVALDPRHQPSFANLGSALREQGDMNASLRCFEQALQLTPRNPDTWFGLGNTLKEMGRTLDAIGAFRKALEIKPDHLDVQVNLSLLLLLSGNLAEGWDIYEQRFHRPKNPVKLRRFLQPRWQGQPLRGERLLVWGEQGAGDKLMGYRLVGEILSEADAIIVETDARLLRLMRHNFPAATWVAESSPAFPETQLATLQTPILSLARFRRRNLESFGDGAPYLSPLPESQTQWRAQLAGLDGLKVGLVWAGSPTHNNDANRSLQLERFAPLFDVPGVSFVSLQVGSGSDQIAASGLPIHDWSGLLKDYADTAGLIANLDLVIAVDTSVAHLAAALGTPTWVLIPFHPDWRWLEAFPDSSPWYAAMRLFRQSRRRDWDGVLTRIKASLLAFAQNTPVSSHASDKRPLADVGEKV